MRHKWKQKGLCPQSTTSAPQLTMHMPRWEQLRSFLTWKTKWWRACKCFLQLQEHKWGTSKKSLSSSLLNPFRSQLSQREHQFSVWRATAKPASKSLSQLRQTVLFHHFCPLSQDWGHCPLPGRCLCPPSVQGWRYIPADVSLQYSEEGNSQLLSLRNNECKRLRLYKPKIQKCQPLFPSKPHSASSLLSLFWELLELQYGNTSLHSTAMAAQASGTEEGLSGLNPAHALLVGHKDISYISLLKTS